MRILIGADTFAPDVNGSATFTRSARRRPRRSRPRRAPHGARLPRPRRHVRRGAHRPEGHGAPHLQLALVPAPVAALHAAVAGEAQRREDHARDQARRHPLSVAHRRRSRAGDERGEARHPTRRHEPHDAREHDPARADPAEVHARLAHQGAVGVGAALVQAGRLDHRTDAPRRRLLRECHRADRRARHLVRYRVERLHRRLHARAPRTSSRSSAGSTKRSTFDELLEATALLDPALDVEVRIVGDGEARRSLEAKVA